MINYTYCVDVMIINQFYWLEKRAKDHQEDAYSHPLFCVACDS